MSENALITKAELKFTSDCGRNGRNFVLSLGLKTAYGGFTSVRFNPLRLTDLLKLLELESFDELVGTYVQIPDTVLGTECQGLRPILATEDTEWFKSENTIYFGSNFFKGYDDDSTTFFNDLKEDFLKDVIFKE